MTGELQVEVHAGSLPAGLEALAALPSGCFFHTPAWLRAVQRSEPHLAPFVITASRGGELQAALPLLAARRFGTLRLYGGAWGTYGGIVARTPEAAAAVRARLEELARSPRVLVVRVHDFAGSLAAADGGWSEREETCQVLDLPDDAEALFHDAFTSQNRNKIRKAEKLGVQVRRARDEAALASYAALYRESARRWNLGRPHPEAFFLELATAEGVDVWLAERGGVPIAGLLNFTFGGQVMNWGNVSRQDAWGASPNNLLHWRAIQAACADADGPRLYNFGGSAGLPGVETFKAAFGARPHVYACRERCARWLARLRRPPRG